MKRFWRNLKDNHGQSLVEYALILALVAIVVVTALTVLGGKAANTLQDTANELP